MDVTPQVGQVTNANSYPTPTPIEFRRGLAGQSAIAAFINEPRYIRWTDLSLLVVIVVPMAVIIAQKLATSWDSESTVLVTQMWTSYVVIHALILGSALVTSSRYARQLRDNPARPRLRGFGLVCLLAILAGCSAGVLIVPGSFWQLDQYPYYFVAPESFWDLVHRFADIREYFWFLLAADLTGILMAGLRIRCRIFEWAIMFGFMSAPIYFAYTHHPWYKGPW